MFNPLYITNIYTSVNTKKCNRSQNKFIIVIHYSFTLIQAYMISNASKPAVST